MPLPNSRRSPFPSYFWFRFWNGVLTFLFSSPTAKMSPILRQNMLFSLEIVKGTYYRLLKFKSDDFISPNLQIIHNLWTPLKSKLFQPTSFYVRFCWNKIKLWVALEAYFFVGLNYIWDVIYYRQEWCRNELFISQELYVGRRYQEQLSGGRVMVHLHI